MKDESRTPVKHQLDHAVPTVIHHPEEDLPVLARWLSRAMEDRTRFFSLVVGLVAVLVLAAYLANGLSKDRAGVDEAWTELESAKTAAERVEIAKEHPNAPASRWALYQAATKFYNDGFDDLPSNRDAALPMLKKALDLFEQVANEAPSDSPLARAAAFGAARTLEARNQLDKAVEKYEHIAKTWPKSDEGKQAARLARELQTPEAVNFYKELYAYKPTETTLPPLGQERLMLPPGHPSIDRPGNSIPPFLLPPPPLGPEKPAEATKLPDDVFTPAPATPTAKPALPDDVFAPPNQPDAPK